jgi:hypothetical protein
VSLPGLKMRVVLGASNTAAALAAPMCTVTDPTHLRQSEDAESHRQAVKQINIYLERLGKGP